MRNAALTIDIECQLDDEYFVEWEDLTDELIEFWDDKGCNCEGSGIMGSWCEGCQFCSRFDEESNQP